MAKQIGQTKDVGFQFGLQKTFSVEFEKMWDFMFDGKGLEIWLGKLEYDLAIDKNFQTKDGIEGFVRVFKHHSHIRINWKKKAWKNMSIVQVRVIKKDNKSLISFHQEKLIDAKQRDEMKSYWNIKMDEITDQLTKPAANSQYR